MNFEKVSFRTFPHEQEYLERLFDKSGKSSVTDFFHWFLAELMKWHGVTGQEDGRLGVFDKRDSLKEVDSRQLDHGINQAPISDISEMIIREQRMKLNEQKQIIQLQHVLITQQQMQLEEQRQYMAMMPLTSGNSHYDPVAAMLSEAEKMARFKKSIDSLGSF